MNYSVGSVYHVFRFYYRVNVSKVSSAQAMVVLGSRWEIDEYRNDLLIGAESAALLDLPRRQKVLAAFSLWLTRERFK